MNQFTWILTLGYMYMRSTQGSKKTISHYFKDSENLFGIVSLKNSYSAWPVKIGPETCPLLPPYFINVYLFTGHITARSFFRSKLKFMHTITAADGSSSSSEYREETALLKVSHCSSLYLGYCSPQCFP